MITCSNRAGNSPRDQGAMRTNLGPAVIQIQSEMAARSRQYKAPALFKPHRSREITAPPVLHQLHVAALTQGINLKLHSSLVIFSTGVYERSTPVSLLRLRIREQTNFNADAI